MRKTVNINQIYILLFSILLLLSINVPTVHKEIKVVVLVLLLLVVVYKLANNNISLQRDVFGLYLVSLFFGTFFIFVGVLNSNPGAIPSSTIIIMWPMLYVLLLSANQSINIFSSFEKVFLFSAYFIPLYGVYFLLGKAGIISSNMFFNIFPEDAMGGVGLYEGSIEVSILNLASILFLAPYIFTSFLLKDDLKDRIVYGLAIFLLLGITFLSGRRALIVVVAFSFLLIYMLSLFVKTKTLKMKLKRRIAMLFLYVCLSLVVLFFIIIKYYDLDLYVIYDYLIAGFSFGSGVDSSTAARTAQFFSLIDGWLQSPLYGKGFGAVASVVRSSEMQWAYELTYVALLFHTGLLGIILYSTLVLWVVYEGMKISNDSEYVKYIFPYITGMLSFLVGNATNPYLFKFDYLWVIFLPVMFINYYKLNVSMSKKDENF